MKNTKGQYGYIKKQRKIEIAKTLIILLLCFAIFRMGVYSTGTKQNLLTIVAVLGCLPMAKFAVNVIVFYKAKYCSEALYNELKEKKLEPLFYDLYFTTLKKNFQISCLDYKKKNLIMLSEDEKIDIKEGEEHIITVLKNAGYENVSVKIYTDKDKFIERMAQLKTLSDDEGDFTFLLDNILSVSI